MANIKASIKSIEKDKLTTIRNKAEMTKIKNATKTYRKALADKNESADALLKKAVSTIDTACSKGSIHKNNANRRKSRLSAAANDQSI